MSEAVKKECIVCKKTHEEIPVVKFEYKDTHFYICPQHIPMLIHDPVKLVGVLPDADKMEGV